jgi:WD40 repeat protein
VHRRESSVLSAAFSPDGTRIVTSSYDKTARIWDAATGIEIKVLRGHGSSASSAAFSPDGARVLTASADNTVCIWDVHFATMSTKEILIETCKRRLSGFSTLSREEMRLVGCSDETPEKNVCAGIE